jgi:hypothetical protein
VSFFLAMSQLPLGILQCPEIACRTAFCKDVSRQPKG